MPIRPENRKLYPANWKQIRANVLYRAHDRCEGSPAYPYCDAENGVPHPGTGSKVVLTIAHLDHNPTNNEPSNLRAWCQLCHNTYDAKQRAANSKARKAVLKPGNFNLTRKAAAVTPEAAGALEAIGKGQKRFACCLSIRRGCVMTTTKPQFFFADYSNVAALLFIRSFPYDHSRLGDKVLVNDQETGTTFFYIIGRKMSHTLELEEIYQ